MIQNKKQLSQANIDDIIYRNEILCELLGFKKYIPHPEVKTVHENLHKRILRWYNVPGVGNFSSAELKFHCDWNWLMSVLIEFKKYDGLDTNHTTLYFLYQKIRDTKILQVDMYDLYTKLTDYAVALWDQKEKEKNKSL